jgi:cyclopropane-fatty-acyl-phospholipid synthase
MLEAVGEEHWPRYFQVVRDCLKPGGIAGLQVITIEDGRFEKYRNGADFIQRYIFPGGMLPSPSVMERQIVNAGLKLSDSFTFGASYARTLAIWQRRFQHAWPRIELLGFDTRFKRMWEFYLAYCEAGFRNGSIDVAQYRITRA